MSFISFYNFYENFMIIFILNGCSVHFQIIVELFWVLMMVFMWLNLLKIVSIVIKNYLNQLNSEFPLLLK